MTNLCDVHSHFLPGLDDGCKKAEESVKLLSLCYENGVRKMFSTSHYYPKESIESFLKRRNDSIRALVTELKAQGVTKIPAITFGAEIAYHEGIVYQENLEALTFGKSNYILLEMPFEKWSPNVLKDIMSIINIRGLTPIIAHIERFTSFNSPKVIEQLADMNVIVQMNCEYLLDRSTQRKAKKMIESGLVSLLGSDTHNLTSRPPNVWKGYEVLYDSGMEEEADYMISLSNRLFDKATHKY